MTGRGIDQALPHSADPQLHERYVQSAVGYLELAERINGPIPTPLSPEYIWGDALEVWEQKDPALRIINLETSITTSEDHWPGKGIHYRMHPRNVEVLQRAGIDVCSLANNHVMDWGYEGLAETLGTLTAAGLQVAGAGQNLEEARAPVAIPLTEDRRVRVYAYGGPDCGIPAAWGAQQDRPGVNRLPDLSATTAAEVVRTIQTTSSADDLVILSIHWGDNWEFDVPEEQIQFSHRLIDTANVDLIHGHSSHHIRPFEVYKGKLILYGCGDFVTDYEGIGGYEQFRGDLSLMYFPKLDPATGDLLELEMVPMQMHRFRLRHASRRDSRWLEDTLNRICAPFDVEVVLTPEKTLVIADLIRKK